MGLRVKSHSGLLEASGRSGGMGLLEASGRSGGVGTLKGWAEEGGSKSSRSSQSSWGPSFETEGQRAPLGEMRGRSGAVFRKLGGWGQEGHPPPSHFHRGCV